jgi:hypothetical protein
MPLKAGRNLPLLQLPSAQKAGQGKTHLRHLRGRVQKGPKAPLAARQVGAQKRGGLLVKTSIVTGVKEKANVQIISLRCGHVIRRPRPSYWQRREVPDVMGCPYCSGFRK